jgi:DNA-binding HxlR family transcriptional regulator
VLHRSGRPLRFSELAETLSRASRDTLAETLRDLKHAGVIAQRPANGAYALTPAGERIGDACEAAVAVVRTETMLRVALKKWPMLVLVAVGRGCRRFNDIKAVLPGITSGALAPALKDLEDAGFLRREVAGGYPPAVTYRLTAEGEALFPTMDTVVRAATAAVAATDDTSRRANRTRT